MLILGRLILNRSLPLLIRSSALRKQYVRLTVCHKFLPIVRSTATSTTPSTPSSPPKDDRIWTIPNILTFARIGASPILGYLIVTDQYPAALGLFLVSGFTDLIDGWIARRYPSQASAFGSFLDPFADKMLVGIVVISLTYVHLLPLWLTALILGRDVAIMCAAGYLRVKSVPPPRTLQKIFNMGNATVQLYPTFISKVNTGVQIGLLTLCMAAPIFDYHHTGWMSVIYALSALSTGVSAMSYVGESGRKTFKMLSKQTKSPPS